jgi:cobalamin biosynthesis protein CobD/CbiB
MLAATVTRAIATSVGNDGALVETITQVAAQAETEQIEKLRDDVSALTSRESKQAQEVRMMLTKIGITDLAPEERDRRKKTKGATNT